jgi:hypothetical protein
MKRNLWGLVWDRTYKWTTILYPKLVARQGKQYLVAVTENPSWCQVIRSSAALEARL